MRKLLVIPICSLSLLVPVAVLANGGGGGFDDLVQAIESRYHIRATHIPMMGLVSFLAHRAESGVNHLRIAEFEDIAGPIDAEELDRMVQQKLGSEWQPVIREIHKRPHRSADGASESKGEIDSETLIFMRPEGKQMGMVVLDNGADELDLVQLSVDAEHLGESVARYSHEGSHGKTDYAN